ncbi:MAG: DUF4340 domain-containing protein [Mariniblastus sp.]
MNESIKTFVFVGVAGVMASLAGVSHLMNQPTNSADFELVGKEFFEEFQSASQAQSLEVSMVDPDSGKLKKFSVENQEGLWRIPSHYNYPAEAAVRLAETASSVIGIARDSLEGRLAKEHERLGVVDPLSDELEDPETAGKRITLKDENGDVVVDYIIGKEAEDKVSLSEVDLAFQSDDRKYYFVRRPDEQQTYKVALDIDLSTKFSDWIDPDILRFEQNELTKVAINNYTIEEDRSTGNLSKMQSDQLNLTRSDGESPWTLDSLDSEKEELTTARIDAIVSVLDELKIAGVRPKLKFKDHVLLTQELTLNSQPEFKEDPRGFERAMTMLQSQLVQKGFNLAGSAQKLELVSQQGQLDVGTDKGVLYTLYIGKPVEGGDEELEIGSLGAEDKKDSDEEDSNKDLNKDESDGEATEGDADAKDDPADEPKIDAKNRYMMIRVSLDASLLGEVPTKPTEPTEPKKPEGYTPAEEKAPAEQKDATPDDVEAPDDVAAPEGVEKPESDKDDPKTDDGKPKRNPLFAQYDDLMREYEDDKVKYELAVSRYKDQTEEYDKKVVEGKKLVAELNQRFADWYYVISADNLQTLQTKRDDLVKAKEPPKSDTPGTAPVAPPSRPDISFPDLPGPTDGIQAKPEGSENDKVESEDQGKSPEATNEENKAEPAKENAQSGAESMTENGSTKSEAKPPASSDELKKDETQSDKS